MNSKNNRMPNFLTRFKLRLWMLAVAIIFLLLAAVAVWQYQRITQGKRDAPEAETILSAQAGTPFQILIPAFMPQQFIREEVSIMLNEVGPGGEPMVQLAYHDKDGNSLFLREWVPINPDKEVLAGSRPVETSWGRGWLLKQGEELVALWTDVGPLRISIYSPFASLVSAEEILQMAETLGPASNAQVFSFVVDLPEVRAVEPPPPFVPEINAEGVQEFTLVVTPGGYDPLRIQLTKGVPARMTFRAIGQVGCGKELIFPYGTNTSLEGTLFDESDTEILEFTPSENGVFEFHCSHQMYRGILTVVPAP